MRRLLIGANSFFLGLNTYLMYNEPNYWSFGGIIISAIGIYAAFTIEEY